MIKEIRLQQYRSYQDKTFIFDPGVNIIVGPNASGKTNLLEAIIVSAIGKSYRARDGDLIKHDSNWARIDAKYSDGESRTIKIQNQIKTEKTFTINNKIHKRIGFNQQVPIVLFEPNHLQLLSGSPELRRNYLDNILEQTTPGFKKIKADYLKNLRQRNTLLKRKNMKNNDLFPWNIRLAHLGGGIAAARTKLIEQLNTNITEFYQTISKDNSKITLTYMASVNLENYENELFKNLEKRTEIDKLNGYTTIGVHREDIKTLMNKRPITSIASRGESRSLTIALKIQESKIISETNQKLTILLFDDVFGELDANRCSAIYSFIKGMPIIITATDIINLSSISNKSIITL